MDPLVVPENTAWLAALGVLPQTEEISRDDYVKEVRFPIADAEELHLTWDTTDQSVRIRYTRGSEVLVDLYRECATLLATEVTGTERFVTVEYRAEGVLGRARIQVAPAFALEDSFLRG